MVTADQLQRLHIGPEWVEALNHTFERFHIDTPKKQAAFIGQCGHECAHFRVLEENLNYRAATLMKLWPKRFPTPEIAAQYERNPKKIAKEADLDGIYVIRTSRPKKEASAAEVSIEAVGALIPGVSRSGSTLTAALFRDFEAKEAARFSFLMGLPAIMAAGLKEFYELYKAGIGLEAWTILGFGLLIASISAFAAIWGLMRLLDRFSSWPFVIYRIGLGLILLIGFQLGYLI